MLNWGHKGRDGVKRNIGGRKCRECPPGVRVRYAIGDASVGKVSQGCDWIMIPWSDELW